MEDAGLHNPRDRLANGDDVSYARPDSGENSASWRFDLNDGLVGFNVQQGLTLRDAFAFFFSPCQKFSRFLSHLESGHDDAMGH